METNKDFPECPLKRYRDCRYYRQESVCAMYNKDKICKRPPANKKTKKNEANLLPQGTPISRSFWESPSLEELARAQNVMPVTDVASLLGGWPGDAGDGFEEEIRRIRHTGVVGG